MSSDEDATGAPSRRAEIRKLHFEKSQQLKKAKSKAEKKAIEDKYALLESGLIANVSSDATTSVVDIPPPTVSLPESLYVEKELTKTQLKKERKAVAMATREQLIKADVGDGSEALLMRQNEVQEILGRIPRACTIVDIAPDGDCLFASIVGQLKSGYSVAKLRDATAKYMLENRPDFEPFVDNAGSSFETYCEGIRTSVWGSDLELQAIARMLGITIVVYTADSELKFGNDSGRPVRLSFHERQYTSNHYNAVVDNSIP